VVNVVAMVFCLTNFANVHDGHVGVHSSLTYHEANDKIIKDVIIIVDTRSNIDKANDDLE
jgi:hypothetical protein